MIDIADALPGRDQPAFPIPERHELLDAALQPPVPRRHRDRLLRRPPSS
ncbi:MAG: hypothetical protein IIC86_02255 [Chloroflexi bacterium]|nr:hypothetical protein [Chloroflexota bacterium]